MDKKSLILGIIILLIIFSIIGTYFMINSQNQNNKNISDENNNISSSEINNTLNVSDLNNSSNNKTAGSKQNSKVIINDQNSNIDKHVKISKKQAIKSVKSLYNDNIKIKSVNLVKHAGYYCWLVEIKGSSHDSTVYIDANTGEVVLRYDAIPQDPPKNKKNSK